MGDYVDKLVAGWTAGAVTEGVRQSVRATAEVAGQLDALSVQMQQQHEELLEQQELMRRQQEEHGRAMWAATPLGERWAHLTTTVAEQTIVRLGERDRVWRQAWRDDTAERGIVRDTTGHKQAMQIKHGARGTFAMLAVCLGALAVTGLGANLLHELVDWHRSFFVNDTAYVFYGLAGAAAVLLGLGIRDPHGTGAEQSRHLIAQRDADEAYLTRWADEYGLQRDLFGPKIERVQATLRPLDPVSTIVENVTWLRTGSIESITATVRQIQAEHYTNVTPAVVDDVEHYLRTAGASRTDRPAKWPVGVLALLDQWHVDR